MPELTEPTPISQETEEEEHDFENGPPPLKPYEEMAKKMGKVSAQKLSEARVARGKIII